jgi:hypothetical protein
VTTIVWDATSRILAADSREVWDEHLIGKTKKIYALNRKNCWIATAGASEKGILVLNYLNKIINQEEAVLYPVSSDTVYKGFCGILLYDAVPYVVLSRLVPMPIYETHYCLGTGGPYALSALKLGKTAIEAVKFASQFDNNTDDQVQHIIVPEITKPARTRK